MVKLFGVRHLSPVCAKMLAAALATYAPDLILLEAPCDMTQSLQSALPPARPPVTVMAYTRREPIRSVSLPLALYSPEYIALGYAAAHNCPLRCIDLPACRFARSEESALPAYAAFERYALERGEMSFEDAWERQFEHTTDGAGFFDATLAFGKGLRESVPIDGFTLSRERHMRSAIACAEQEYRAIAVICGAFHAPVLTGCAQEATLQAEPDEPMHYALLPGTYRRMATESGYGGGNQYPRYYEMLYLNHLQAVPAIFLTETADYLRARSYTVSTADILDAVRLAQSLGNFRGGGPVCRDILDGARACFARSEQNDTLLEEALWVCRVGNVTGALPPGLTLSPLVEDFKNTCKTLRLTDTGNPLTLRLTPGDAGDLDTRRSVFLHRLRVLGLPGATLRPTPPGAAATREDWQFAPDETTVRQLLLCRGEGLESAAAAALEAGQTPNRLSDTLKDLLLCALPQLLPRALALTESETDSHRTLSQLLEPLRLLDAFLSGYRPHSFPGEPLEELLRRLVYQCRTLIAAYAHAAPETVGKLPPEIPVLHSILSRYPLLYKEWVGWCRLWCKSPNPLLSGCAAGLILNAEGDISPMAALVPESFTAAQPERGRLFLEGALLSGRKALLYDKAFWDCLVQVDSLEGAGLSLRRALTLLSPQERAALPPALQTDDPLSDRLYGQDRSGNPWKTPSDTAKWLENVRLTFSPEEARLIQRDAMTHPGFLRQMEHPALCAQLIPDTAAAARLLSRPIPPQSLPQIRTYLDRWMGAVLPELTRALASKTDLTQRRTGSRPRLDIRRTVRHNIRLYDPQTETLRIVKLFFAPQREQTPSRDLFLLIDRSGSMAESSVCALLVGCALFQLGAAHTRLFAFADKTEEWTAGASDPLSLLLSLPHGGGTDLTGALEFVEKEIPRPNRTHLILVSDLLDGGEQGLLLDRTRQLLQAGVKMTVFLSLSPEGVGEYEPAAAQTLEGLGVRCVHMSPYSIGDMV